MEICFLRENPRFCSITLQVDNSPIKHFLLKFDVTGVNGQTVTNAKLCLYNKNGATEGGDFYPVSDDSWQEETVTWNNAPTADTTLLASLGSVSPNTWYEVDVTSLVTGDGTYSFRISDSVGGADYSSKEGTNDPELVLTLGGTPVATNTPTNTPTPGPSPTPTNTPTATHTPSATATQPPPAPFNSATFVYDGDGKRVKSTFNGTTTTYFVGAHYEVTNGVVTKYYYGGSQRIAMRTNGTLNYLLGDHLGSTSLTTNASGQVVSELHYKAWGETRYATGNTPTKYQYTGQYSYASDFGLLFYNARWYDPALGRFIQADIIIPSPYHSTSYDRYAYTFNNPIIYNDPSGHCPVCIVVIVGLKVLDWGWTAWDTYQSTRVLSDSSASQDDKLWASLNISLAGLEFIEPDELLPVGLPIDDIARRGAVKAFKEGGLEGGLRFIKKTLGDKAPTAVRHLFDKGYLGGIRTAGDWNKMLDGLKGGANLAVHHIIEKRWAAKFGIGADDLPAVVLDRDFHQQITTSQLHQLLHTNKNYAPQQIWNAYETVYGKLGYEKWLDSIWPYFEKLGVKK